MSSAPPPHPAPAPPAKYQTTVRDVRDLTLFGSADLDVCRAKLEFQGLVPFQTAGRAQVALLGCGTTYMGVRFRELSLSISVSHSADGSTSDAVFLVTAFNSVRFFAWVERTVFRTPYDHGDVQVEVEDRPNMQASTRGAVVVHAATGSIEHRATRGEERWEGPIYLPRRRPDEPGKYFFGRLVGSSKTFPFDVSSDRISVQPRSEGDRWGLLHCCDFRPERWQFRTGAVHSRTRTFRR